MKLLSYLLALLAVLGLWGCSAKPVPTQPTTEPSKPVAPETTDEPQDTPNNEKRPTGTAKMLGMGMILATLAVAGGTAGFFAIRKGRKK